MNRIAASVVATVAVLTVAGGLASAGEVLQRERSQDGRIDQGVRNGELSSSEAKQLIGQQRLINQERRTARSNGSISRGEFRQLNHEQNQASRDIYHLKHNEQTAN